MAITVECLICDSPLELAHAMIAIARLRALIVGRAFPYDTPLLPGDRRGLDDGSSVTVKRQVRPYRLADGKFAIPISSRVRAFLTSGRLAEVVDLTAAQRTRLLAIWASRRTILETELNTDQGGLDE